jgi:hypothetical protein
MRQLTLRPDQRADVARFLSEPTKAGLNATVVGGGKTATAVQAVIEVATAAKRGLVVLIVAPLNTQDGWDRTIKMLAGPDQHLKFVTSSKPENIIGLREGIPGWYFGGWEFLRQFSLDACPIDFLIGDEIHRAQNRKSDSFLMFSYAANAVARRGGWRMTLSATPYGNRPAGAFGVAHSLWPDRKDLKFHAFWPFVENYVGKVYNQYGGVYEPSKSERLPGGIARAMPCYWRHEQDFACCEYHPRGIQEDLPRRVTHQIGVDLSATQRKIYDELERRMFAWVEEHDTPIQTHGYPLVLGTRLRQVCLAVPTPEMVRLLKSNPDGTQDESEVMKLRFADGCTSTKIDAVMDIMADVPEGERVLILTHSAGIIPAIVARLAKAKVRAEGWYGAVNATNRQRIKDSFIQHAPQNGGDGSGVQVIVAQIGAIGEGVDGLQWACSTEIWFSLTNNGVLNTQAAGRLVRDGQTRAVNSYSLEARDTIEIDQLDSLNAQTVHMTTALRG